ncbi:MULTISPECIES: hypothetical protein [Bacillus amyloliquefaciens group]|uniref:hypothetical protein n=1 Tax=Bacillus amyloliquefaciens group TaxID=1938374 RepID=UPI0013751EFF|nr:MULTISPECIES: hypothetical protein [Bacillus amyloliquefaciens group]KAF1273317.1 hypothetical protein BUE72_20010 [Bacillus amyloliquefaciens]MCO6395613.1 hypothetical protein [Bacillus velezensis]
MSIAPPYDECQIRFRYYMLSQGIKPGDEYKVYEFMIWINRMAIRYKKLINENIATPIKQDDFTRFIEDQVGFSR